MIVLDTNVLVDLDRYVLDVDGAYGASLLSRAELEFGINAARDATTAAQRVRHLARLDDRFEWIEFDLECTRSYGFVAARANAKGAKVRGKDALIAAQAHRHGAAVMTANLDDFAPFAHLVQVVPPPVLHA